MAFIGAYSLDVAIKVPGSLYLVLVEGINFKEDLL